MQIPKVNTIMQNVQKVQSHSEKQTVSQLQTHQNNFQDILNNTIDKANTLQFSKHAALRLKTRDIQISNEQMQRIEDGITKAKQKGIKDSLVLVDNLALVVNTKNNIVITAMEQTQNDNNVYTNIDGAVIV